MSDTSLSLLNQLQTLTDGEAWPRLLKLYEPLLRRWLTKYELQPSDVDDVVQNVLLAVAREIPEFNHSGRTGAFRGWLKAILINRLRNHWRCRGRKTEPVFGSAFEQRVSQLEDPSSELSLLWNQEHDLFVLREILTLVERQFSSDTWLAFRRVTLDGISPEMVAKELGISTNAVFVAKSRVLSRLRREAAGLVDSSSGLS